LGAQAPDFPFVALVVSGGHTNTYRVDGFDSFKTIGQTRDDAAGEAFDKAAKLLGIGYPGGVVIDRLSRGADYRRIRFPRSMRGSADFSFSGLKTSLLAYLKKREMPVTEEEVPGIVASYQEAIVDVLVEKTLRAAEENGVKQVAVVGGVAANSRLRQRFSADARERGIAVFIPDIKLCTDNAAMIAVVGDYRMSRGERDGFDLNALSRWPLELKAEGSRPTAKD